MAHPMELTALFIRSSNYIGSMIQINTKRKGGKIQNSFMAGATDRLNTQLITDLFLNPKQ